MYMYVYIHIGSTRYLSISLSLSLSLSIYDTSSKGGPEYPTKEQCVPNLKQLVLEGGLFLKF